MMENARGVKITNEFNNQLNFVSLINAQIEESIFWKMELAKDSVQIIIREMMMIEKNVLKWNRKKVQEDIMLVGMLYALRKHESF